MYNISDSGQLHISRRYTVLNKLYTSTDLKYRFNITHYIAQHGFVSVRQPENSGHIVLFPAFPNRPGLGNPGNTTSEKIKTFYVRDRNAGFLLFFSNKIFSTPVSGEKKYRRLCFNYVPSSELVLKYGIEHFTFYLCKTKKKNKSRILIKNVTIIILPPQRWINYTRIDIELKLSNATRTGIPTQNYVILFFHSALKYY